VGSLGEPFAWLGALALGASGVALLATDRRGRWMPTAAMVGVQLVVVHLLLTLIVLPRFDAQTSARAWGVRLGRIATRSSLVASGFRGSEGLAPYLFYAGRQLPELDAPDALRARIAAAPACIFIRKRDYARLRRPIPGRVAERGRVGDMDFLLVESSP